MQVRPCSISDHSTRTMDWTHEALRLVVTMWGQAHLVQLEYLHGGGEMSCWQCICHLLRRIHLFFAVFSITSSTLYAFSFHSYCAHRYTHVLFSSHTYVTDDHGSHLTNQMTMSMMIYLRIVGWSQSCHGWPSDRVPSDRKKKSMCLGLHFSRSIINWFTMPFDGRMPCSMHQADCRRIKSSCQTVKQAHLHWQPEDNRSFYQISAVAVPGPWQAAT